VRLRVVCRGRARRRSHRRCSAVSCRRRAGSARPAPRLRDGGPDVTGGRRPRRSAGGQIHLAGVLHRTRFGRQVRGRLVIRHRIGPVRQFASWQAYRGHSRVGCAVARLGDPFGWGRACTLNLDADRGPRSAPLASAAVGQRVATGID